MVNFYIDNALGQNLTNLEYCLCKRPKSVISGSLSKNSYVWATQWPTSIELKIKFDPSLDRSWCDSLKIESKIEGEFSNQSSL